MKIDTTHYSVGKVREHVHVWSNDPQRPKVRLVLEAAVTPVVLVAPSRWISIQTVRGKPASQVLVLTPQEKGVTIKDVRHDLGKEVGLALKGPASDGSYTLEATAKAHVAGIYAGCVWVSLRGAQLKEFAIRALALIDEQAVTQSSPAVEFGRSGRPPEAQTEKIN